MSNDPAPLPRRDRPKSMLGDAVMDAPLERIRHGDLLWQIMQIAVKVGGVAEENIPPDLREKRDLLLSEYHKRMAGVIPQNAIL